MMQVIFDMAVIKRKSSDKCIVLKTIIIIAERELGSLLEYDAKKLDAALEIVTAESPGFSPEELFEEAKISLEDSSFVRAMILLRCASALYTRIKSSYQAPVKIEECMSTANDVILTMLSENAGKFKQIAILTCLPIMQELFEDLKKIEDADTDVKTEYVAWGYYLLGYSNKELGRYTEAYNFSTKAKELLERDSTRECENIKVFAYTLHQLGAIMCKRKEYKEAEKYCKLAKKAWGKVEDHDEHEKKGMIKALEKLLEVCKKKTEKQ